MLKPGLITAFNKIAGESFPDAGLTREDELAATDGTAVVLWRSSSPMVSTPREEWGTDYIQMDKKFSAKVDKATMGLPCKLDVSGDTLDFKHAEGEARLHDRRNKTGREIPSELWNIVGGIRKDTQRSLFKLSNLRRLLLCAEAALGKEGSVILCYGAKDHAPLVLEGETLSTDESGGSFVGIVMPLSTTGGDSPQIRHDWQPYADCPWGVE